MPVEDLIEDFVFSEAVRQFWETRDRQGAEVKERGVSDQGSRGAVTGGQQMNEFANKISALMVGAGVAAEAIFVRQRLTELPGFYRPSKQWDLIVATTGELKVAVELKAQVGPSFGNNFNNRTEEALGTALDIWTAFREKAFKTSPAPWLGYLFLLEDSPRSKAPVAVREPHFGVFPEFRDASYARRYELFCRKLVLERQYNAACFLMAEHGKAAQRRNYTEPADDLSAKRFLSQLLRHVAP